MKGIHKQGKDGYRNKKVNLSLIKHYYFMRAYGGFYVYIHVLFIPALVADEL
jgi:hypothetical protein